VQHSNRIKMIKEWLPQAEEKRATSECRGTEGFADMFSQALGLDQLVGWR